MHHKTYRSRQSLACSLHALACPFRALDIATAMVTIILYKCRTLSHVYLLDSHASHQARHITPVCEPE